MRAAEYTPHHQGSLLDVVSQDFRTGSRAGLGGVCPRCRWQLLHLVQAAARLSRALQRAAAGLARPRPVPPAATGGQGPLQLSGSDRRYRSAARSSRHPPRPLCRHLPWHHPYSPSGRALPGAGQEHGTGGRHFAARYPLAGAGATGPTRPALPALYVALPAVCLHHHAAPAPSGVAQPLCARGPQALPERVQTLVPPRHRG